MIRKTMFGCAIVLVRLPGRRPVELPTGHPAHLCHSPATFLRSLTPQPRSYAHLRGGAPLSMTSAPSCPLTLHTVGLMIMNVYIRCGTEHWLLNYCRNTAPGEFSSTLA